MHVIKYVNSLICTFNPLKKIHTQLNPWTRYKLWIQDIECKLVHTDRKLWFNEEFDVQTRTIPADATTQYTSTLPLLHVKRSYWRSADETRSCIDDVDRCHSWTVHRPCWARVGQNQSPLEFGADCTESELERSMNLVSLYCASR